MVPVNLANVIGTIWATRKHPAFEGKRFLLLQPVEQDGRPAGQPLAAVDTVGAGPGERVFYITAREAVIAVTGDVDHLTPVDAAVVGIVDQIEDEMH